MNIKSSAIAAALLVASFAASADSYSLGTLDSTDFDSSSTSSNKYAVVGTVINDTWTFTIDAKSAVSFGAQQTFSALTSAITDFAGYLDGYGALSLEKKGSQQNLSWAGSLAAGTYTVHISGITAATNTSYTATVSAQPVPEPETYALMLAGLGAVAFVARRRKSA